MPLTGMPWSHWRLHPWSRGRPYSQSKPGVICSPLRRACKFAGIVKRDRWAMETLSAKASASALLAATHSEAERGKMQVTNDLIIFSLVAIGSPMSEQLLHHPGGETFNLTMLTPILMITVALMSWHKKPVRKRTALVPETRHLGNFNL